MGKDDVCLGCSKKFNKSESCVKCNICGLWSHKQCAGLTDELFKMMEAQIKVTGNTCWACKPCLAYAAGITTKMKELEGRLEGVEKRMEDDSREVKGLAKKVEKVEEAIKKKDDKVDRAVREAEYRMSEEMRERGQEKEYHPALCRGGQERKILREGQAGMGPEKLLQCLQRHGSDPGGGRGQVLQEGWREKGRAQTAGLWLLGRERQEQDTEECMETGRNGL